MPEPSLRGGLSCSGGDVSELHFAGKMHDGESNLDDFGARYYTSAMGRWMTPDWSARGEAPRCLHGYGAVRIVRIGPVPYAVLTNPPRNQNRGGPRNSVPFPPQTLNLYAYLGDNPATLIDQDGHGPAGFNGFGCQSGSCDQNTAGQNQSQTSTPGAQYQLSQNGLESIEREEGGFHSHVYDASGNKHLGDWTVGYGHRVLQPGDFPKSITKAQAVALLKQDVATAVAAVNSYATAMLSQNQVDALVSFTFNVGSTAFQNSTLRARMVEGETVREHDFTEWHYSRGQPVQGLLNRRIAEYRLFSKW